MTTGPDEIDRLVAAALGGDRAALNGLLAVLRPLIVRYCRSRLAAGGDVAADDVAQDVCLAVLKALPEYVDQGRPFLAFVYGIAAHKVVDAHRRSGRRRAEPRAELPDHPDERSDRDGPEAQALLGSASAEMLQLLATLPTRQREILVLRVVVGLSAEETALAVGATPGAVRVAQHRALARLRGAFVPTRVATGGSGALATLAEPRADAWLAAEEARSDWEAAPRTGLPEIDAVLAREDERDRA